MPSLTRYEDDEELYFLMDRNKVDPVDNVWAKSYDDAYNYFADVWNMNENYSIEEGY